MGKENVGKMVGMGWEDKIGFCNIYNVYRNYWDIERNGWKGKKRKESRSDKDSRINKCEDNKIIGRLVE